ncbi:MAG: glutamate-1-semialdehyde-2,1-aminomutase [Chlamydiae bacterium CG10_big_fil_rev_8_21_14_0_10_42_34]|nr:MAG: glutamate-1-semialdehyde-2,1-aminomutase [Chlamydiae bacterium CG10_big_fil_rev_8_21_14_0_10_42_34]
MRNKSSEVYANACKVIPGGVNSPVRSFRHLNMDPLIVERGLGDQLFDVDGNSYIDFCTSWGSLILGHAHPQIVQSVCDQMYKGSSFGIATDIEEKIASKIVSLIPSIEKIRFVNSGTEATMTAMRLAKGFTERAKIIKFSGHYHGHSDSLLIQAGSGVASLNPLATSKGVNLSTIADTICLPFNDIETVRSFFRDSPIAKEVAGVILEPVTGNMGVVLPEPGFLQMLREETLKLGTLLIFDEVITGFRLGLQGAQGIFHIEPDLTCLGKIIGGGFPVAALGGRGEILDCLAPLGQVYQAGTLSGNPVAMRAGLETLCLLETGGFYESLQKKTDRITAPIIAALEKKNANACLQQLGSMFNLFFGVKKVRSKEDLKRLDEGRFVHFFKHLFERGIYISPSSHEAWFVSSAHTDEHIDKTVTVITAYIDEFL